MTQYVAYPDRVRMETDAAGRDGPGDRIVVNGDDIIMDTPQGVMPAPPQVREQVQDAVG